uniref:Microtubule-associated protein 2 n=1 Tax=Astyanax mexicanus TaxID=7994 RepID=A0A3B1IGW4_ASTMX
MADGRQPEDSAPQWAPPGAQGSASPVGHGENGFSYRACQPGGSHAGSAASYAKENGFNGDLPSGHAVTAEQVSARIVQEVTELHPDTAVRLPSVEDSANLPPSPPPSPAAEHFGPLEQGRFFFSCSRRQCVCERVSAAALEEQEELEEEEEEEEQWSGEEPEEEPPSQLLEQAEVVDEAQASPCPQAEVQALTAGPEAPNGSAKEAGGEESPEKGVSSLLQLYVCVCVCRLFSLFSSVFFSFLNCFC